MITAIVPTSPISSHPDTAILEETLNSIRHHLPDAEIIVTFDGVRPEQDDLRANYAEYIRRALWQADKKYGNVCPIIFDEHVHQTGMMRRALEEIQTPLLLYVEHDTPLVVDEPIDWDAVRNLVEFGDSDLVRFHHEAAIPDEHRHMMHGEECDKPGSWMFTCTSQWSQRPHVASRAFYERVMAQFSPDAKSFIEDKMHGVCDQAFKQHDMLGWEQYRLHIYNPGGNIKRSYHTDGRAGEAKFDGTQVF